MPLRKRMKSQAYKVNFGGSPPQGDGYGLPYDPEAVLYNAAAPRKDTNPCDILVAEYIPLSQRTLRAASIVPQPLSNLKLSVGTESHRHAYYSRRQNALMRMIGTAGTMLVSSLLQRW